MNDRLPIEQLKEKINELLKASYYKNNKYTDLVKSIIKLEKISEKQYEVLYKHYMYMHKDNNFRITKSDAMWDSDDSHAFLDAYDPY